VSARAPFCFCRPDDWDHACLRRCYEGHLLRAQASRFRNWGAIVCALLALAAFLALILNYWL
jgi:hypothetical protein